MRKIKLLNGHLVVSAIFCLMLLIGLLLGQLVYFQAKFTSYQKICQYNQAETMKNMTVLNRKEKNIKGKYTYNYGVVEYKKGTYQVILKNGNQYSFSEK